MPNTENSNKNHDDKQTTQLLALLDFRFFFFGWKKMSETEKTRRLVVQVLYDRLLGRRSMRLAHTTTKLLY